MKATIETTEPALLAVLQPLLPIIKAFPGYLNASYTKGRETRLDNIDKRQLCCQLHFFLVGLPGWKYGTGAGHIWISYSKDELHQPCTRVLLITDN